MGRIGSGRGMSEFRCVVEASIGFVWIVFDLKDVRVFLNSIVKSSDERV